MESEHTIYTPGSWTDLPQSFSQCETIAATRKRKLGHNTYLDTNDAPDSYGVRLHATNVVRFHADGRIVLDSGGWQTVTTKNRMNRALPPSLGVWTDRGIMYLGKQHVPGGEYQSFAFADGITIHPDGSVTGQGEDPRAQRRQRKAIRAFAKRYVVALMRGDVPPPGPGDCLYCGMHVSAPSKDEGKALGEATGDVEHFRLHFAESYYVPSMMANALRAFPQSPATRQILAALWDRTADPERRYAALRGFAGHGAEHLYGALVRYLYRAFGLADSFRTRYRYPEVSIPSLDTLRAQT